MRKLSHTRRSIGWITCCCAALAILAGAAKARAQFIDDCTTAPTVSEGVFTFNLTLATASEPAFTPSCAGDQPATLDQWVRFIPAATGPYEFSTIGLTTGDTVLSLHDYPDICGFAPFAVLACNDNSNGPQSRIIHTLIAGQGVLVRIAGAGDSRPSGSVRIAQFTPLAGDTCSTALPARDGVNSYDTTTAVVNQFEGSCYGFRDVWFTYTPAVSGGLTVSSCDQPTQANISVIATCGGRILGCSNYGECFAGTAVQAGVPVLIRLANDSSTGPEQFTITLDPNAIPANDNCATAATVAVGNTEFNNTFATDGFSITSCGGGGFGTFNPGLDVWFTFTPPVTGVYDLSTELSTGLTDTFLAIYTSCSDAPFVCNDDSRGFLSFIRTELQDDQIYLIQVAGAGLPNAGTPTNRGAGTLSIRRSIAPANDTCDNATTVIGGITTYNLYDATTGAQVPSCLPANRVTFNDVWFRYVPTSNGPVEASLLPGGAAGSLSVFASCGDAVAADTAGTFFDTATGAASPRLIVSGQAGTPLLFRVAYENYLDNPTFQPPGTGDLYIGPPTVAAPPNDRCASAQRIIPGITNVDLTGSIKDCTAETGPQFDSSSAVTDNDVFYSFTATTTGQQTILISDGVEYPNFDGLVVSVYTSCGAAPVAGSFTLGDAPRDFLDFDATAGSSYIIRVGSVLAFGSTSVLTGSIRLGDTCLPDVNHDGTVDGSDFIAFINSFSVGDPIVDPVADVAGGGDDGLRPDGIVDGNDFIAFINGFAAGC